MHDRNVLRVNTAEEQADYRNAVAEIINRIVMESSRPGQAYTYAQIAEAVDVSLGTISNAANKKCDLSPTYLKRLAKRYGPHILDPFLKLSGGRAVPIEVEVSRDILPMIGRANLKIAMARDPASPGGVREIHTEKADYLPDLRALQRDLGAMICQIEQELAA